MRTIAAAVCLVLMVASCGADRLTEAEYADEIEDLTTTLFQRIEDLARATGVDSSGAPTMAAIRTYYNELTAAFRDLAEGLEVLQPPEGSAEDHDLSIELANSLTTATEAFASLAEEAETEDELQRLFDGPEAEALVAARDQMIAFCQEGQADFDATADREAFGDAPWIPSELQEVIRVALGC